MTQNNEQKGATQTGTTGPEWFKFYTSWRSLISTTPPERVVAALLTIIDYVNNGEALPDWAPVINSETGRPIDTETKLLVLAFKPAADNAIKRTAICRVNGGRKKGAQ